MLIDKKNLGGGELYAFFKQMIYTVVKYGNTECK